MSAADCLICRCEDVRLSDITACVADLGDAATPGEVKRRLRAGMGWCQGRVCGPALAEITADVPLMRSRVVRPVTLGAIAAADTESEDAAE